MARYSRIESVQFDGVVLPLPVSVKTNRSAAVAPRCDDARVYESSVQLHDAWVTAEFTCRGLAVADSLSLGQQGDCVIDLRDASGSGGRRMTLHSAVVVDIRTSCDQRQPAETVVRLRAQADDVHTTPYQTEVTP